MLVAHPSAMRQGARLEARARAAPIVRRDGIRKNHWTDGYYDLFPLPRLAKVAGVNGFKIEDLPWAVDLQLAAPVETTSLHVTRRVVCLSADGVHLLLQRLVFADTRAAVRLDSLADSIAPKLDEIELLHTWNEDLIAHRIEKEDPETLLLHAAEEFDEVLGRTGEEQPVSIRTLLESRTRRGEGQRLLMDELRRRREALDAGSPDAGSV